MSNPLNAYRKTAATMAEARRPSAARPGEAAAARSGRGCLVVTRPLDDAIPVAERLRAAGFKVLIEPMLSIRFRPGTGIDLTGVRALLFTSANGVRSFVHAFVTAESKAAERPRADVRLRDAADALALTVYTTGDATAAVAREAGFGTVRSAQGDGEALVKLAMADAAEGRLGSELQAVSGGDAVAESVMLHVRGRDKGFDVAGALAREGFATREIILYEAAATHSLSQPLQRALDPARRSAGPDDPDRVQGVLFFSTRTVEVFADLADKAGLAPGCRALTAWCISGAVAAAARRLPWARVVAAPHPDGDALVACVVAG
ncbi:MAG: uroporphyrinogen-III synthase [Alphaproteobacteria bacterium]|nr:uroporphyrinogen-III synthase [Alphaproteobacteria bacterium]